MISHGHKLLRISLLFPLPPAWGRARVGGRVRASTPGRGSARARQSGGPLAGLPSHSVKTSDHFRCAQSMAEIWARASKSAWVPLRP